MEGNHSESTGSTPIEEHNFLIEEIDLWLTGILIQGWSRGARRAQSGGERALVDLVTSLISGLGGTERDATIGLQAAMEAEPGAQPWDWGKGTLRKLAAEIRASMFPIAVAMNKADRVEPATIRTLMGQFERLGVPCKPTSAEAELTLSKARKAGLIENSVGDGPAKFDINSHSNASDTQISVLEKIRARMSGVDGAGLVDLLSEVVFSRLSQIVVYPVADEGRWTDAENRTLPDAILLPSGSTARDLAFAVHSDLGNGFIRATNAISGRSIRGDSELSMSDVIRIYAKS